MVGGDNSSSYGTSRSDTVHHRQARSCNCAKSGLRGGELRATHLTSVRKVSEGLRGSRLRMLQCAMRWRATVEKQRKSPAANDHRHGLSRRGCAGGRKGAAGQALAEAEAGSVAERCNASHINCRWLEAAVCPGLANARVGGPGAYWEMVLTGFLLPELAASLVGAFPFFVPSSGASASGACSNAAAVHMASGRRDCCKLGEQLQRISLSTCKIHQRTHVP